MPRVAMKNERNTTGLCKALPTICLVATVIGGLFLYLKTAWFLRHECNGDLAIVQMMALDIVHGTEYPMFFYGQAYMGSLEPFINALTYLIFGRTTFALQLGTLVFTIGAFFFTFRIARRIGGIWCAILALVLCALAPMGFVHYSVSPRGGYGVLFLCTMGLLDLAAVLIAGERERREGNGRTYSLPVVFALGLLAGIAFWCNQLAAPAVAATGLAVLVFAPRLLISPLFWLMGLCGFLIGSAPFWVWNLQNGWESFRMAGSVTLDSRNLVENTRTLLLERWPSLFHLPGPSPLWRRALFAATLIPCLLTFVLLLPWDNLRRGRGDRAPALSKGQKEQIWLLFFYLGFFTLCFICSAFAAQRSPRYLLPLWPVLAILLGFGASRSAWRAIQIPVLCSALFLVTTQWGGREAFRGHFSNIEGFHERAGLVVDFLRENHVKTAFTAYPLNSFNVFQKPRGGDIVFSDCRKERIPRFRLALERDDSPAVIENYMNATGWAIASGGKADQTTICNMRVATGFVPPSRRLVEIPPSRWVTATNLAGAALAPVLTDRSAVSAIRLEDHDILTVILDRPIPVTAVRIFGDSMPFFDGFSVYGRDSTAGLPYKRLSPVVPNTGYAWSGTRFYHYGNGLVREARLTGEDIDELQIRFVTNRKTSLGVLYDLQLLTDDDDSTPKMLREALPDLLSLLHRQGVRRLYAERWVANNVTADSQGSLWTNWGSLERPGQVGRIDIHLDSSTAILMAEAGVPSLRDAFRLHGFLMREIPIAPFGILFLPETNQHLPLDQGIETGIAFCETYALTIPDYDWIRQELEAAPVSTEKLRSLYRLVPDSLPLLQAIRAIPPDDKTEAVIGEKIALLTQPTIGKGLPVYFKGGIVWHGARLLSQPAGQEGKGTSLVLRNYWSAPLAYDTDGSRLVLTLMVEGSKGPVGSFNQGFDTMNQYPDSIDEEGNKRWHKDLVLSFPEELSPGDFNLHFNLHDSVFPSMRLPLSTDLPAHHQTICLKNAFSLHEDSF